MTNTCSVCGANIDMVGRSHRCIPKSAAERQPSQAGSIPKAGVAQTRSTRERDGVASVEQPSTYKYRDPDKWRAYMRGYMAKRREKTT
jgi:hypothetical protein